MGVQSNDLLRERMVELKDLLTLHASVVSTVAVSINVRNWMSSGVRLNLSLMTDAMTIGGVPGTGESGLTLLTVDNRGDASTMLTHMIMLEMPRLQWIKYRLHLKYRPKQSYLIPNPQVSGPSNIPSDLEPGKRWIGAMRPRPDLNIHVQNGSHCTGVIVNTRNRPYLIRIPKKHDKLPEGTTTLS